MGEERRERYKDYEYSAPAFKTRKIVCPKCKCNYAKAVKRWEDRGSSTGYLYRVECSPPPFGCGKESLIEDTRPWRREYFRRMRYTL